MSTQTIFRTAGSTSQTVKIALVQKASATSPGDPITGLVFNSGSLTCYQSTGATGAATAISLVTQTVGGAYSSGGFVELSSTNMPGIYRFDIPNAQIATKGETDIVFNGAASMATHTLKIIVTEMDFYSIPAMFTSQMTESYNADGTAPTVAQALYGILQNLTEFDYIGAARFVRKLDGTTPAMTITLDSAATPTNNHRTL